MSSKYSRLFFSAKEYHHVGPFRFPIYRELTAGEAELLEDINRRDAKNSLRTLRLARRLQKDFALETLEAAIDLMMTGDREELKKLEPYQDELDAINTNSTNSYTTLKEIATAFIRFRAELELNGSEGWKSVPDWTEADTDTVPRSLLNEIFEFVKYERDGWPTVGNEAEAPTASTSATKPKSSAAKAS